MHRHSSHLSPHSSPISTDLPHNTRRPRYIPPPCLRKWKWYRQLMLPNISWPQVLSWGKSWARLQDWDYHCWRLITALWCWHLGRADPSTGRASSHLPSVAFKGLSTACKTEPRPGKKDAMVPQWLYFTYFNGTSVVDCVSITPPCPVSYHEP